jgi:formylglycine-generating enzyme required for sulfatase activity
MKYIHSVLSLLFGDMVADRNVPTGSGAGCLFVVLIIGVVSALTGILVDGCQNDGPEASFFFDPASGPAPLTVSFMDTSKAGASPTMEWAWTFGDGSTSDKQRPSHTYDAAGEYTISLTVTSSEGSDTIEIPNCITVTASGEGESEGETEGESIPEGEGESIPNGALHVTILPADAVADGAIWTLDHGFNHESDDIINNIAPGTHTISFKDLGASWKAPDEQTVEVVADQVTEVTGRYRIVHNIGDERTFAGIVFKWIPPGTFYMGTLKTSAELSAIYGYAERFFDPEHPRHQVMITRGFWLGKFEVTQAQWSARMPENPAANVGATLPVEQVSWDDCQAFIIQLNQIGEGVFRLPTEAEWEHACRAGTETEFYWGDDASQSGDYVWRCLSVTNCSTQPVGRLIPNAWGLYDIGGNVMEWCSDYYDPAYYTEDAVTDPQGPVPTETEFIPRVRRGGGTANLHDVTFCRSAMRYSNIQEFAQPDTGFRVLRESED